MINKLTFDKIKIIAISFIMIAIPSIKFLSYVLYLTNVIEDSFLVNQVYVLWAMIPFLLILYIYGLYKKKDKINYIDYIIYFLIILAIISTIFSIEKTVSIYGEYHRNEGLLSILSYYLIFLNAKSIKEEKTKKFFIKIFLILGLFQVLYALIQIYLPFNIVKRYSIIYLAMGLCGNPNFLGSYMAMLVIYTSFMFIKEKNKIYLILTIIYNIGLTLAGSTGPFLSVVLTLIFIMIYLRKKETIKRFIILSLSLLITFVLINYTSIKVCEKLYNIEINAQYNIVQETKELIEQLFGINNQKIKLKELGNRRVEIWLNLLPKTKDYWLTGSGLDTIQYIYPQTRDFTVDKAHNVYLQILLTNGLFALLAYLYLLYDAFKKGLKLKDTTSQALYMVFIVYSIQAFLNISVIDVAPYFFLFFGLLYNKLNNN